ncbi:MAG: hypothetical protein QOD28_1247 [Acidobacteriota bacterium]|nr:hypothetical protein [Acidobacteriota bacterium]
MAVQKLFSGLTEEDETTNPESIHFDLDSFKNKNYLTHNFHPYPAKFVPQIPQKVIQALTKRGDIILDPFCGSGTSLVEASLLNRHSIGFDLNPIAGLISRVKTTPLTNHHFNEVNTALHKAEQIFPSISTGNYSGLDLSAPDFLNKDHWFQPHVQQELAVLRNIIWQVSDAVACDFLKVAFSAIIVKVSNQDSDTRWVAVQKNISRGDVIQSFLSKARDMVKRVKQFSELEPAKAEVYIQPLTDSITIPEESIDLAITSPPYLNSYDYYLYHKLRFFWLGLDHYSVQARELGSRHRHCDKGEGIESYTTGITSTLKSLFSVLKSEKYICVVIGDSILKGQLINMEELYQDLANGVGFKHIHSFSYDQRKYSTSFTRNMKTVFKQSHIMFFQKP